MKKTTLLLLFLVLTAYAYALKPDRNYIKKPGDLGINYKEHTVTTPDKYSLKVWQCFPQEGNDKKTTLVLAYGDSGNMSYWLEQTSELTKAGFTVVLFDYRGFGKSSDFKIDKDYLYYNEFATDLTSVTDWAKTNLKENKTGIWALSMGTIVTTLALKRMEADFLIAEAYVISPVTIQQRLKDFKNKNVLLPQGADRFEDILKSQHIPTLLFIGTQDDITIQEDGKTIEGLNPANKLVLFNGNHLQGFQTLTGNKYINVILDFIK